MADIQSNISVNIDTSNALASLKALQGQISAFHQSMSRSGALAASEMSKLQNSLMNSLNRSGQFDARLKTIKTTTESFTEALEKNKMSMGQYFRYAGAATKDFGRFFGREFDTIEKVARERVKDLQTQYIKLGRDANGAMKSIAIRPLMLDLEDMGTKTQIAAQKQQLLNQLLKQGSTNMLNWGKNTQWAGRQLMVGFTIPLTMLGQVAGKTFMDMEEQVIKFQRVYGDFSTTAQQTREMTTEVTNLAKAFTKYGLAVSDTMGMAADAAAMGKTGADLLAQVESASRLAVLGGVDQKQALETTISLTNAFGIAAEDLTSKINFLNVVENQTVTSIEDLTIAVPKAGPVIQQLGGSVEDLAFFLTAMKEGGINASEGANALKSGLASIINPTKKASDMLAGMGININKIVQANKGDVKGIVVEFGEALNQLDPLKRAQAIEQLFGKFQFARLSTLFKNVTDVNSQASKVAELAAAGPQASAILAQRELKKIEESPMFKFKKALEDLKTELIPLGEQFLKMVTPIANFITKMLEGFNNLSAGTKDTIGQIALWLGGFGPVLIMTIGLIANGIANMIKVFATIKAFLNGVGKGTQDLGSQTSFMTQKQIEAAAVAASLDQVHSKLKQTFTAEAGAVALLAAELERAVNAQRAFGWTPGAMPGAGGGKGRKKFASGGRVAGSGSGDTVPALLTPGEFVVNKKAAGVAMPFLEALNGGQVAGFSLGGRVAPATKDTPSQYMDVFAHAADPISMTVEKLYKKLVDLGIKVPAEIQKRMDQGLGQGAARTYGGLGFTTRQSYNEAMKPMRGGVVPQDFLEDWDSRGIKKWTDSITTGGGKMSELAVEIEAFDKAVSDQIRNAAKLDKNFVVTDKAMAEFVENALKPLRAKGSGLATAMDNARNTVTEVRGNIRQSDLDAAGFRRNAERGKGYYVGPNGEQLKSSRFIKVGGGRKGKTPRGVLGGATMSDFVIQGVEESTDQKSPSRKAKKAGENIGVGALQGIEEGGKEAKAKGKAIGTAVRTQAQQDATVIASRTRSAYKNDATLRNLEIQKQNAIMMGADTALMEQQIAARKAAIAADVKKTVAAESTARVEKAASRSEAAKKGWETRRANAAAAAKKPGIGSKIVAGAKNIGGKIMGGGVGAGMGIGMAGMAVGMIPGMEGVGQAISMAGMIPTLLPMLANPIGIAVAAIGALTVGVLALNAVNEENKKKQIALGNAQVMSTDALIQMSKDLGTVSISEARRTKQANMFGITEKDASEAATFMETDSGKKIISDIQTQKAAGKTDQDISASTTQNLANAVLQGVMSEGMAKAILMESAKQTGNYKLSGATGDLSALVKGGPSAVSGATMGKLKENFNVASRDITTEGGLGETYTSTGDVGLLRTNAVATANAYSQIMGGQDIVASQFESGKISLDEYNESMEKLKIQQREAMTLAKLQREELGSEYDNTFKKNIEETFGADSPAAKSADKLNALANSDFKTNMQLNLSSGNMTPDQINRFIDLNDKDANFGKNYQATVDLVGQGQTNELINFLTGTAGYSEAQIALTLSNPEQAEKLVNDLNNIKELTANGPVTFETAVKSDPGFAGFKSQADWFNGLPAVQQRYFLSIYKTITDAEASKAAAIKKGVLTKDGRLMGSADSASRKISTKDVTDARTNIAKKRTVEQIKSGAFDELGGGGGGGGGTTDKASAALSILGRKEEKINKAYDERLKALDKIQQANDKINQQKKDQLDLADALSKGDIGAAARAQQQARETAQANAIQEQRDRMNAAKEAQIAALRVNGMSREQLEAYQANEANKKDLSALGKWAGAKGFAIGGMVPKTQYLSIGGEPKGTDTISAMLTPGEFVVKKSAVDKLGAGTMKKINNGQLPGGNSVYNYSISVNVKSDADADQIANAVLTKIQKIDDQAMRGDKA